MEILVGTGLALAVAFFATGAGLDRDRAFYPVVLVVVASYYDLFAIIGGSYVALGMESLALAAFVGIALLGFKKNLWLVAGALLGHGIFDLVHGRLIANPGVPDFWPMFCSSYDVVAAAYLAVLLIRRRDEKPFGGFGNRIHPHVEAELVAAANCEKAGDAAAAFRHLERAHVLGQFSTIEHVRVHARMLIWGVRQGDRREILAQALRIAGAVSSTVFGLVPTGNTGGSNVSPFRPMPIPDDLAAAIASASKRGPARASWLVPILIVALFVCGCGPRPIDLRIATIEGHRIAYRVAGTGPPVLVMISGLGDGMDSFRDVIPELAKTATVIVYDRGGYGASSAVSGARDAAAAERDLSALLAQSGVPGPYVLLGHSLGGLFAEYYAAKHPHQIAGLILEESRPADFTRRCETGGIAMCAPPSWLVWFMPNGARGEVSSLAATNAQVEAAQRLRGKPVLVLSRSGGDETRASFDSLWTEAQAGLAARYPGSRHLTAVASGHYIHRDRPDWFVGVVRAFLTRSEKINPHAELVEA